VCLWASIAIWEFKNQLRLLDYNQMGKHRLQKLVSILLHFRYMKDIELQ